jgi:hypothetical protein
MAEIEHLTDADREDVFKYYTEMEGIISKCKECFDSGLKHQDPPHMIGEVCDLFESYKRRVTKTLSKPKPKVEEPKKEEKKDDDAKKEEAAPEGDIEMKDDTAATVDAEEEAVKATDLD